MRCSSLSSTLRTPLARLLESDTDLDFECNRDLTPVNPQTRLPRIYSESMGDYWTTVEPVWDAINIYDGPEVFRETFDSAPRVSGLMFAAHFCQSEICNGGFHQFFSNSTGVLAPEAVDGFREIGQSQIAVLVESAMDLVGSPYPRDREERQGRLLQVPEGTLDALDEKFFVLIESEAGGFEKAADRYVERMGQSK